MSKSKMMVLSLGLVMLFTPTEVSSETIRDDYMEGEIHNRIEEIGTQNVEEVEVVSTHAEFIPIEVEEEVSKKDTKEVKPEYRTVNCELTFYTDLAVCNGSNAGKNAIGGYLSKTSIAIPRKSMPFGTKIDLGEYGIRYADDVGSPKYIKIKDDGTYIFDVFMPRIKGESDKQYKDRIMSYGRVKTTAKIYDQE